MEGYIATSWWRAYKEYVGRVILPDDEGDFKDISYWRNQVFCIIATYLIPFGFIALIPSISVAFIQGIPVIAIADTVAFFSILAILLLRNLKLSTRKMILFSTFYGLSVVLLHYYSSMTGGMTFLLTTTILISLIYSSRAAYYSVLLNSIICFMMGVLTYLGMNSQFSRDYDIGVWIGVSFTVVFLCLVCAHSIDLLLKGLEATLSAKNISEGNLRATIENTDAYVYSLDRDFRYITFNRALKNSVKSNYDVDVNRGDLVFDFLEKDAPEDARFWENIYSQALTGKTVRFEKDFNQGDYHSTTSFSINPILNGGQIIGLSCIATDITELKRVQLEIQQLNANLEMKVTERTSELMIANRELEIERDDKAKRAEELAAANKELHKTQEELVAANQELEAFSYSVSHDLRAPLRAVESYAQMLEEDYTSVLDKNGKRLLGVIQKSGVKMGNLIDDLLTLSRLGKKEMRRGKVNMTEFTHRIIDELTEIAPHHAKVIIHPLPFVLADAGLMNHVLTNLLGNALKYSAKSEKPRIEIAAREENGEVVFSVTDNGVGFDMRYANKLFGVFQRLHADSEFQGTGVGLAIVKRIIDRHVGRIWATAEPGKGATFYFTLPAYTE